MFQQQQNRRLEIVTISEKVAMVAILVVTMLGYVGGWGMGKGVKWR
jgi:hypothetical protein